MVFVELAFAEAVFGSKEFVILRVKPPATAGGSDWRSNGPAANAKT